MDLQEMCNKEDLNMSFYEAPDEEESSDSYSLTGDSSYARAIYRNTNFTSADSGYDTNHAFDLQTKVSSLEHNGLSFSSIDMEEFVELDEDTSDVPSSKLPSDFELLIDTTIEPSQSLVEAAGCSKKRLLDESLTLALTPLGAQERKVKKFKTPELQEQAVRDNGSLYYKLDLESSSKVDLIGDYTQGFSLPVITGRHPDLKSITPTTLVELIQGKFDNKVTSFKIIDCRYPYEFEGGHVKGAINLYTKEQIANEFMTTVKKQIGHILVFHCEFSSERAPNLCRVLRELDRNRNENSYPALCYPELYLLDGGYKRFFSESLDFCVPQAYLPMRADEYQNELLRYKSSSKFTTTNSTGRFCFGKRLEF